MDVLAVRTTKNLIDVGIKGEYDSAQRYSHSMGVHECKPQDGERMASDYCRCSAHVESWPRIKGLLESLEKTLGNQVVGEGNQRRICGEFLGFGNCCRVLAYKRANSTLHETLVTPKGQGSGRNLHTAVPYKAAWAREKMA